MKREYVEVQLNNKDIKLALAAYANKKYGTKFDVGDVKVEACYHASDGHFAVLKDVL